MILEMSLDDVPKKVQYVVVDSNFVNGTNNTFSLDLTLKSNTHVEDMSRVLGIKLVDFYITQIGEADPSTSNGGTTNIAKYVDIVCPDIPKVAQILDYFNPISIKKLNFTINEQQDDGDYVTLQPDAKWYMILEITTVNVKEKPKDRELQILRALEKLLGKIDRLNDNVERLPDKPPDENPKKYSFGMLIAVLVSLLGGFIWWVNKSSA